MSLEERKLQISAELDASGITTGVAVATKDLQSLLATAKKFGDDAKNAVGNIGEGGQKSADKIEDVTRNIRLSIERATAAMAAGARGSAEYFEAIAQQRGANMETLRPLIENYKQVENATRQATEAAKQFQSAQQFLLGLRSDVNAIGKTRADLLEMQAAMLGVSRDAAPLIAKLRETERANTRLAGSAREVQLAYRMLAPQVTDIVTSLASGQAPIQVLIQQGGQLKDMFGGVGGAAKALGSYLFNLINPFTIIAGAIAGIALAYKQGSDEASAYNRALIMSGQAAGVSAGQLNAMARAISQASGTQREAAQALAVLAGSTRISGENLQYFASVASSLERTVGQPVAETRKQFEELGKSPVEASRRLDEQYNYLTASVYAQIRALEEQGKITEAADLAQRTFADAMKSRSSELVQNLGYVEKAWKAIIGTAKSAWDAMLNIGRTTDTQQQLDEVNKRIANFEETRARALEGAKVSGPNAVDTRTQALNAQFAALQLQRVVLEGIVNDEAQAAQEARRRSDAERASKDWIELQAKFISESAKHEQERAKIRETGLRAGKDEVEIAKMIAAYDAKNVKVAQGRAESFEAARTYGTAYKKIVEELIAAEAKFTEVTRDTSKAQEILNKAIANDGFNSLPKAWQDVILEMVKAVDTAEQMYDVEKRLAAIRKEQEKESAALAAADEKRLEKVNEAIRKQQEEIEAVGLTAQQLNVLKAARENESEAQELQQLRQRMGEATTLAEVLRISELIDKLETLQRLRVKGADAANDALRNNAVVKAAEDAQKAWQKTADDINKALTDSFFRAAESGKSIFEAMRDAIKGLFANLILRPIIGSALGALTGSLGLTGTAAAATGASGGLGTLGGLTSMGGALGTFGSGFSSGLSAWSEGGSVLGLLSQGSALFSGGIVSGLATIAGALAPIGLAVAALVSLLNRGGGPKEGGQSIVDVLGGKASASALQTVLAPDGGRLLFTPSGSDKDVAKQTAGIIESIRTTVERLGGTLKDFTVGLGFDIDQLGDAGSRISSFLRVNGEDVYKLVDRDVGRDPKDLQEGIAQELVRLTIAGLQASNLPQRIQAVFQDIDLETVTSEQFAAAVETASGFVQLSKALDLVGASLDDLSDAAIEAAGGAAAAASTVAKYYEVTRTDAEKLADATRLTSAEFQKLGFSLPESVASYRDLVEGIDTSTSAGQQLQLALMKLAPAVAEVSKVVEDLTDNSEELIAALELERDAVQTEMDGLIAVFGDLSKTLAEMENPAETVADTFLRLGNEIDDLTTSMNQILGLEPATLIEQLQDNVSLREAITGARQNVDDLIQSTQLQGFIGRGDLQGGIGFLKSLETALYAELQTTTDPAGVSAKIAQAISQRYDLEARLAIQAGETRAQGLRDEIAALESMKGIAEQIAATLLEMRTGSLSALAPREQLGISSANFFDVLAAAQAGDVGALRGLSGAGTQFLTEAQSFFASGGDYAKIFGDVTGALDAVGVSLENVPMQLSLAQDSLTQLESVADYSEEMATDLGTLSTTLGTLYQQNETNITTLVTAIQTHINDLIAERSELLLEYERNRVRWTELGGRVEAIDNNIKALRDNSDLAAARA